MQSIKKKLIIVSLSCLIMLIFSCLSSSVFVDKWNDPSFKSSPINRMFVVAIRENQIQRRIWEDAFIKQLSKQKVKATASYHLFPDALPNKDQILESIQENKFEGILTSHVLTTETNLTYIEGNRTYSEEYRPYYQPYIEGYQTYIPDYEISTKYYVISGSAMLRYYQYWPKYYNYYYEVERGYTNIEKIDRQSIDIWTTGTNGHIVYSATSKTPESVLAKNAQYNISSKVVKDLVRYKIISKKK